MFGRHRAEEQRLPLIDVRQQQAMGPRLNSAMNYFPLNGRIIVTQLCMASRYGTSSVTLPLGGVRDSP
jgi:hypothetical protein